jgi:hypothetical protein
MKNSLDVKRAAHGCLPLAQLNYIRVRIVRTDVWNNQRKAPRVRAKNPLHKLKIVSEAFRRIEKLN